MLPAWLTDAILRRTTAGLLDTAFTGPDIAADIREKYGFSGDLLDIYTTGSPRLVHKWHHYIPIYDQYFARWRGKPVRFLEIGVFKGGSLSMWRRYLGPEAIIYGIDIDPACAAFNGPEAQVRIGSQDDPDFLRRVVEEMGGVDVVLDDGSHMMGHIRTSLETLFPLLSVGGTYMVEDLHTAYWRLYGGGYLRRTNFFHLVREIVDDMHATYHSKGKRHAAVSDWCAGIHLHDSIVVLDKAQTHRPTHSMVITEPPAS
ncbi:class I SAM-dependent methyltransferase [Paragemmobacter straminiformis]|uniref:Class I SAM-dependent methyltransferase n=1 Tax=Paragemmobacter straminiformis TaxID=2045119 RepID=A0A842I769_9RHOB|nr:class I SAM-dependent methyltransferase [Gemmobacter straminiformis]MBC2835455.1 class I SAM-dependent methyltransferase [Gemmobacter straminiformis]